MFDTLRNFNNNKVISIDFDGVIHKYSKGWQDGSIYDDPVEKAFENIQRFIDAGFYIVICTARDNLIPVKEWIFSQLFERELQEYVDAIHITNVKIPAVAYIDDRAIRFTNWDDIRKYFM